MVRRSQWECSKHHHHAEFIVLHATMKDTLEGRQLLRTVLVVFSLVEPGKSQGLAYNCIRTRLCYEQPPQLGAT